MFEPHPTLALLASVATRTAFFQSQQSSTTTTTTKETATDPHQATNPDPVDDFLLSFGGKDLEAVADHISKALKLYSATSIDHVSKALDQVAKAVTIVRRIDTNRANAVFFHARTAQELSTTDNSSTHSNTEYNDCDDLFPSFTRSTTPNLPPKVVTSVLSGDEHHQFGNYILFADEYECELPTTNVLLPAVAAIPRGRAYTRVLRNSITTCRSHYKDVFLADGWHLVDQEVPLSAGEMFVLWQLHKAVSSAKTARASSVPASSSGYAFADAAVGVDTARDTEDKEEQSNNEFLVLVFHQLWDRMEMNTSTTKTSKQYKSSVTLRKLSGVFIQPDALRHAVHRCGGVDKVRENRHWQKIRVALQLPWSTSSAWLLNNAWNYYFGEDEEDDSTSTANTTSTTSTTSNSIFPSLSSFLAMLENRFKDENDILGEIDHMRHSALASSDGHLTTSTLYKNIHDRHAALWCRRCYTFDCRIHEKNADAGAASPHSLQNEPDIHRYWRTGRVLLKTTVPDKVTPPNILKEIKKITKIKEIKEIKELKTKKKIKIGDRLSVYWPLDKTSYSGQILDIQKGLHHVQYDDGEFAWLNLEKEKIVVEDTSKTSVKIKSSSSSSSSSSSTTTTTT